MNQESGGNKRAINLWDINARNGIPSKGLMQVIDPTFDAYKHPSLPDNVWNPLSNIVASMRYALARYGSLSAAYNRPGGYDKGGLAPGIGLLPKYTIKPERVLSPSQTKAFEDWMRGEHDAQRSLIGGDLVIQSKGDTREDLGEALFQLRRIQRGGRYA